MMNSKIIKKIKNYKYISFDIFDTLIKRNVSSPSDVFEIIEKKYNIKDFKKNRIFSERVAREKCNTEITLKEIYNNMLKFYPDRSMDELIEIEKECEIKLCTLNPFIKDIYEYCKNNDKKIIITSDMYLPLDTIQIILNNNNIIYDQIFVSCEIGKTKGKSDIYPFIINQLDINKEDIIHIGDNFKSDYLNARINGVMSIWFKDNNCSLPHFDNVDNIDEVVLKSYILNSEIRSDYFFKTGYSLLGPLLYAFCIWLHSYLISNNIKKVLFFSRDGLILKKAYELMYGESDSLYYFYASRRALIVPAFKYCKSLEEMLNMIFLEDKISVKKVLKNLGLEIDDDILTKALEYDISLDKIISLDDVMNCDSKEYKFLDLFYSRIIDESEKENEALVFYLKSIVENESKIGIVDIGWFGNMQNSLERIINNEKLNIDLYGYYVGLNPNNIYQNHYNMEGFLFDNKKNIDIFEYERRYNSIFETMFSATHPSLKKYNLIDNNIDFIFKENDNDDKKNELIQFQSGGLYFIKKYCSSSTCNLVDFYNISVLKFFNDFGTNPNLKDAYNWGNLKFESGSSDNYIAKPSNALKYIFNLKSLFVDFKTSYWKIGFLKRILKIKINYNKLYDYLKKGK